MARSAINEKGTSLIEILVSLVLVSIVFSGLIQSSLLVMNTNVENLLRDEAVSIADIKMDEVRNTPFSALATIPTDTVTRDFRGITGFPFYRTVTVTAIDSRNRQVQVTITWTRRGIAHNHNITTVVRDPNS